MALVVSTTMTLPGSSMARKASVATMNHRRRRRRLVLLLHGRLLLVEGLVLLRGRLESRGLLLRSGLEDLLLLHSCILLRVERHR